MGAIIFAALTVTQICEAPSMTSAVYHLPMGSKNPADAIKIIRESPDENARADQKILLYAVQIARAPVFRMAAGFPYYVDIFSNPDERCGIWAPHVFPNSCFPPIKAYEVAYPFRPNGTTGYLPAPVNTSALAEAGYAYSAGCDPACWIHHRTNLDVLRTQNPPLAWPRLSRPVYSRITLLRFRLPPHS